MYGQDIDCLNKKDNSYALPQRLNQPWPNINQYGKPQLAILTKGEIGGRAEARFIVLFLPTTKLD